MKAKPRRAEPLRTPQTVGAAATARHCGKLTLASIVTERPSLVLVRQGLKQITRGTQSIDLQAGEAVMVPPALAFDLVNTPVDGAFVATMLSPAPKLIDEIAAEYADVPIIRDACALRNIEPDFLASFDRAVAAASEPNHLPRKVIENREREVLHWLAHKGLKFGKDRKSDVTQRVRALVSRDLERNWKAHEVAGVFAMSEATFRRRLREHDVSFQQLLIDVRMTRALALLQLTNLSIGQIALSVGYDSPSRFAVRFKRRFAISPSDIRA